MRGGHLVKMGGGGGERPKKIESPFIYIQEPVFPFFQVHFHSTAATHAFPERENVYFFFSPRSLDDNAQSGKI